MNRIGALLVGWTYQFSINSVLWIGIFLPYLLEDLSIRRLDTIWIISVHSCVIFLSSLLGGYLSDRFGLTITSSIGIILYHTGLLAACGTDQFIWFLVTYSVVGGLGSGILFNVSIALSPLWWKRERRIFSTSLLLSGAGIGSTVYSNIIPILCNIIGWRWTLFAYGSFSGIILLTILPFTHANEKPIKLSGKAFIYLRDAKFWLMWLAGLMFSLSYLSIFLYYPYILRSIPYFIENPTHVPIIYSLIGITMTVVRLILTASTYHKHNINPCIIICITMITLSINLLLLPMNNTLIHSIIFSILYGSQFSLIFSMFPLTVISVFNTKYVSTFIGLLLTSYSTGVMIGPYVFGKLLEYEQYWYSCIFCAGCCAISSVLWGVLLLMR